MRIESDKKDNIYKAIKKAKQKLNDFNKVEWDNAEHNINYVRFKEKITLVFNGIEVDILTDSNVDDIATIYNLKSNINSLTNKKIKDVIKEIYSQCKDKPITPEWIGFRSYLD